MTRLLIALALVVSSLLAAAPARAADAPPNTKRPNILWIVSEDNDPFLGCYGDKFANTPVLDKLAAEGVLYLNAFANAPVCGEARTTLITGMYGSALGTHHMRSRYPIPADIHFYCTYLRAAGYYCMNPGKTDYNIQGNDKAVWDKGASWKDAPAGKPWMLVINNATTHESCLHGSVVHPEYLKEAFTLPPYHPDTPEIRSDWVEYYHKMTKMDGEMGVILDKLAKDGLADDTIVFYYSDHGGILPRSKRSPLDSGLHVPMIVRFGKNVQSLAPAPPGSKLDRLVSFIDLPPSLCSLAGAPIPKQFQGTPFLGTAGAAAEPRQYVYGFRGRMDERYDLAYTIRDKQFRYVRNYYPHLPWGQHHDYLWKMPAMVSWEKEFLAGRCNATQSAFFLPKPEEELFDETADHYEVNNLAADPAHKEVLERLRTALHDHLVKTRDVGFLPEPEMAARAKGDPIYTMSQDESRYPMTHVLDAADTAARRDAASIPKLITEMTDPDAAVRYWAAVGCSVRAAANVEGATAAVAPLEALLKDPTPCVRTAAAEALCRLHHPDAALPALVAELNPDRGTFNILMAINTLESLGDAAKPVAADVKAALAKAPAPGQGENYIARAAEELNHRLAAP